METKKLIFRGKTEDGHWTTGPYCHSADNKYCFIFAQDGKNGWKVDNKTVGLWSGMFDDSNPQERIFDGDILLVDDGEDSKLYKVIFNRGCFMVKPLYSKDKNNELPLYMFFAMCYGKKIIVVDDIYSWDDRLRKNIDNAITEKFFPLDEEYENEKYTSSSYLAIVDGVLMEFPTLDEYIEFLKEKEQ